jgi:hypothetical protein
MTELVLESTGRPGLAQALRELFAFRGTVMALAERDLSSALPGDVALVHTCTSRTKRPCSRRR